MQPREMFLGIAALGGLLSLAGAMCHPSPPNRDAAACISARTALELRCVDQASTRDEADRCRAAVVAAHDCVTDGGSHD